MTEYALYTDRVKTVMRLANQEAQRFNHLFIGTEHILLGLVKEGAGIAAHVLAGFRVTLRDVRIATEKILGPYPDVVSMGRLPQTPTAKSALDAAANEALALGHNYIGTEHLLLGLVVPNHSSVAVQILGMLGVSLDAVRQETLYLIGRGTQTPLPATVLPDAIQKVIDFLNEKQYPDIDNAMAEIFRVYDRLSPPTHMTAAPEPDKLTINIRCFRGSYKGNSGRHCVWLFAVTAGMFFHADRDEVEGTRWTPQDMEASHECVEITLDVALNELSSSPFLLSAAQNFIKCSAS